MSFDPIVREFLDELEKDVSRELLERIEDIESEDEKIALIIDTAVEQSQERAACDS